MIKSNINKVKTQKPKAKAKAKAQRAVSRAVKEAGFKNVKEVKETLKAAQANIACDPTKGESACGAPPQNCCASQTNYTFSIPKTDEYRYIREEYTRLLNDPLASKAYIQERMNYLLEAHADANEPREVDQEVIEEAFLFVEPVLSLRGERIHQLKIVKICKS